MELKPGYKQTQVGVIPDDWDATPISSLLDDNTRITYGVVQPGKDDPTGVLFIRGGDVFDGTIDVEGLRRIPVVVSNQYQRTILRGGEILISLVGFPGESALVPSELAGSNIARQVALVRLSKKHGALNEFICHYLRSPLGKGSLLREAFGSAQQVINLKDVNKFEMPLPAQSDERIAISAALSDVDALLAAQDALIGKKRAIKQGVMQELLTGKRRLPGFIREWEVKRLGALGDTYGGLVGKSKAHFGCGHARYVPFVNVMANVVIDANAFDRVDVGPTESQNRVMRGDLLLNGSSETADEVAMCALVTEDIDDLYLNSFCFGFRIKDVQTVDGLFFTYYMRGPMGRDLVRLLAQGSTRYNLSKKALLDGQLRMPEKNEQVAIANVLSDMDAELTSLQAKRAKTTLLKQGMMQELLTGTIRLV